MLKEIADRRRHRCWPCWSSRRLRWSTLVDVNRFKPQIEQFVQDRYQRTLRIGGDLGLSLFPRLALSLPPSSLSEAGGAGEAASLDGAKVSVAVMPLLRGEIDCRQGDGGRPEGDGRAARGRQPEHRRPDRKGTGRARAAAAPPPARAPGGLPRLDIGGIELTDAQVVFRDLQAEEHRHRQRAGTEDRQDRQPGRDADRPEARLCHDQSGSERRVEPQGRRADRSRPQPCSARRTWTATVKAVSGPDRSRRGAS